MTTLVWDESGTRVFETGVDKGILFPMEGLSNPLGNGVVWNGLTSVSVNSSGGEIESYHFNGVKYMDYVLAEEFEATITAISSPREFDACEGVKQFGAVPGLTVPFGKRAKFNMAWRTKIGNDQDPDFGYKLHILYNATVQPSTREYQTVSDNTTPDVRSWIIKASPACGRHSYFVIDSRDVDLSGIEAILDAGVLPKCSALSTILAETGSVDEDPNAGCLFNVENFDEYANGEYVNQNKIVGPYGNWVYGTMNTGLDVVELPANSDFAANSSAATVVGSGAVLADADDATYITSAHGDLGYTVKLPRLTGYVPGSTFELHIRMSITGGISADDPDEAIDADAQVFVTSDSGGDFHIGGFSDGHDEGKSFKLSAVDGTIVDYVVPLDMTSWLDTDIEDVAAELTSGGFLNFVSIVNNNYATTPVARVYEATVVMHNATNTDKFIKSATGDFEGSQYQSIFVPGSTTTYETASHTDTVDFMLLEIPFNFDAYDYSGDQMWIYASNGVADHGGFMMIDVSGPSPLLIIKEYQTLTLPWHTIASAPLALDKWYTITAYWNWTSQRFRVSERDTPDVYIIDLTVTGTGIPKTHNQIIFGQFGSTTNTYEAVIDNSTMQIHCNEPNPADPEPDHPDIIIDLPAYNVIKWSTGLPYPGDPLAVNGDGLEVVSPYNNFAIGNYGNGPGAPTTYDGGPAQFYPPAGAIPDGYEVLTGSLVVVARCPDTVPSVLTWSAMTPAPTTAPFLSFDHDSAFGSVSVSGIHEGSTYAGEIVRPLFNNGYPMKKSFYNWEDNDFIPNIYVTYVAARLTYRWAG